MATKNKSSVKKKEKTPKTYKLQPVIPFEDYKLLAKIAEKQNRKPGNLAALIIMKWIKNRRIEME